ncbi:MAG TPA: hypothetical protein VNN25_20825, partial [Thermoanaerobaculia bacterium]|nr:hypothetical protein [Thermoanaerobaculia bacterium]
DQIEVTTLGDPDLLAADNVKLIVGDPIFVGCALVDANKPAAVVTLSDVKTARWAELVALDEAGNLVRRQTVLRVAERSSEHVIDIQSVKKGVDIEAPLAEIPQRPFDLSRIGTLWLAEPTHRNEPRTVLPPCI